MHFRATSIGALLAAVAMLSSGSVEAGHPPKKAAAQKAVAAQSVGSPNEGKLVGGKQIEPTANLRVVGWHRWGMPELVGMLERSAARVAKRHPGGVLSVGDLSRRGGGDIDGHRSHESGRDADVAFYLVRKGKPFLPQRFATVDADGRARGLSGVEFDDARNWELVAAWLNDPEARVLQIFVSLPLRARLLGYARKIGAPASLQARAADVLIQPRNALPHDNHFHVRIGCSKSEPQCVDYGTPVRRPVQAVASKKARRSGQGAARGRTSRREDRRAGAPPRGAAAR